VRTISTFSCDIARAVSRYRRGGSHGNGHQWALAGADATPTPHGDKVTQQALAELEAAGYLEGTQDVDQIPGPITFRLIN